VARDRVTVSEPMRHYGGELYSDLRNLLKLEDYNAGQTDYLGVYAAGTERGC
jgi:hypothetical protein